MAAASSAGLLRHWRWLLPLAPPPLRSAWWRSRCRCGRRGDSFLAPRASEVVLLCQCRPPRRVARGCQRMIRRQFPAGAIRRGFEPMSDADMPAQHLAAEAAVETDHIVPLHRAPDLNRRRPRCFRQRDVPETGERSLHFDNEARELIDADLVMLHIAADNARDETRINLSCRATSCHRARPVDRAALLYPARHSFESGRYDLMKTLKLLSRMELMRRWTDSEKTSIHKM